MTARAPALDDRQRRGVQQKVAWAVKFTQDNWLDGHRDFFRNVPGMLPAVFATKRAAQEFIKRHYGYLAKRQDLRREPHCWRVPKPVRVTVTVEEVMP